MKKIALSAFVIICFILYSVGVRQNGSPGSSSGASSKLASPKTASSPASSGSPSSAKYKDGTYTGPAVNAFYGDVRVQAEIHSGKIIAVKFLEYPKDSPNSVSINQQAIPYLQQEAIRAQNARVDGVSGATDTSAAFKQSLSAALSQAM